MTRKQLTDMSSRGVVITGGAGHIGRTFTHALCELGAQVTIVDLDEAGIDQVVSEINSKNLDGAVSGFCWDLANRAQFDNSCKELVESMQRIDVLINNAAFVGTSNLTGWVDDFERQSVETFNAALNVNLTIPFALSQNLSPHLRKTGAGSIINIGSIYGSVGPDLRMYRENPDMGNPAGYSASKGGLHQLTRWMSTVLAPEIRVNMVSPGGIERGQNKKFIEQYVARTPMGRMASEDDVVGAALYFSTDLSKYVTGQNLIVDGGYTVW